MQTTFASYVKNALHFKDEVKATLTFIRYFATLKDKNFKTFESCDNADIDAFWEILLQLDGSLTGEDTTKKAI